MLHVHDAAHSRLETDVKSSTIFRGRGCASHLEVKLTVQPFDGITMERTEKNERARQLTMRYAQPLHRLHR